MPNPGRESFPDKGLVPNPNPKEKCVCPSTNATSPWKSKRRRQRLPPKFAKDQFHDPANQWMIGVSDLDAADGHEEVIDERDV